MSNTMSIKSLASFAPGFALPVLFLGYAVVANYEFISGLGRDIAEMPNSASAYLSGEAAAEIDTYYKKIMPHRLPSIDLMGAGRYLLFKEGRPGVVVGEDGWLFSKEEFDATLKRTPDLSEALAGVTKIRDELAAKGIELVVVPLPAKADIYSEHVSYAAIPGDLERLYSDFRAMLDQAGIRNVETRTALLDAKAEGQLFLNTDTHWTPLGASVVADTVGAALGQRDTAFTIADTAPVEREGDLSKFIVTGGLAPLVGLGPETVVPRQAIAPLEAAPRRYLRTLLHPVRADRHQLQRQRTVELWREPQGRARLGRAEHGRRGQGPHRSDARPARFRHPARQPARDGDLGIPGSLSRPGRAVERGARHDGGGQPMKPLLALALAAMVAGLLPQPADAASRSFERLKRHERSAAAYRHPRPR